MLLTRLSVKYRGFTVTQYHSNVAISLLMAKTSGDGDLHDSNNLISHPKQHHVENQTVND
jgi:hypothetical protein